jgi:glycosyltransferase involved in cell wall biosynthesis
MNAFTSKLPRRVEYDLSIVGVVGLPASYGGFETLAEQLTLRFSVAHSIQVFCSGKRFPDIRSRQREFCGATLRYLEWDANGWQSIPYDIVSIWHAARVSRSILILGVSGCVILPVIRIFWPNVRIVTNIDGIEWKREKWGRVARWVLRASEWFAVRFSHSIVVDNRAVSEYVDSAYGCGGYLIAYGGDHVLEGEVAVEDKGGQTKFGSAPYFLALCRIEPENNIGEILEAFAALPDVLLVFVGNWGASKYGRDMRRRFEGCANIECKDPVYDLARLRSLRSGALGYVHGHSAGGTNPSLVEAMYSGMPVIAYDVAYNRYTTNNRAIYWSGRADLFRVLKETSSSRFAEVAIAMSEVAQENYTWTKIAKQYEDSLFCAS